MFVFCAIVSIILLIAKIVGLISIGFIQCFIPMFAYVGIWVVLFILATIIHKE